jgi:hypothetical protein
MTAAITQKERKSGKPRRRGERGQLKGGSLERAVRRRKNNPLKRWRRVHSSHLFYHIDLDKEEGHV